jgi:hypothetical protein
VKLLKIGETFINPAFITRIQRIKHRPGDPGPVRYRIWFADANPQDLTTSFGDESEVFQAWLEANCEAEDVLEAATKPTKPPKDK